MADEQNTNGTQPDGEAPKPIEATQPVESAPASPDAAAPVAANAQEAAPPAPEVKLEAPQANAPVEPPVTAKPARAPHPIEAAYPEEFGQFKGLSAEGLQSEKVLPKVKAYDEALNKAYTKNQEAFDAVVKAHEKHLSPELVVHENGSPVKVDGKLKIIAGKEEAHKAALTELSEKKAALNNILKADTPSDEVKAFNVVRKEAQKLQSAITGQYHAHGPLGAVKSNFNPKSAGNGWGNVAIHGAITVAGGAMLLHAFKSKTSDGQDRSWVTRLGEGALGTAVLAGGLVGGKARI